MGYPTSVFSPATRSDGQTITAAIVNDIQAEVTAVENALLGTITHSVNVSGASTLASLAVTGGSTLATVQAGASTFTSVSVSGNSTLAGTVTLGGGQLSFPATQNASAGANTLDDYEEGTWTPVIGGSGGTSGQTYSSQTGTYTKVGRLVHVEAIIILSAKGTITGNVQIQGLPFAPANYGVAAILFSVLGTNWVDVMGLLSPAVTYLEVTGAQAATTSNRTALTTSDITNTTQMFFQATYSV